MLRNQCGQMGTPDGSRSGGPSTALWFSHSTSVLCRRHFNRPGGSEIMRGAQEFLILVELLHEHAAHPQSKNDQSEHK